MALYRAEMVARYRAMPLNKELADRAATGVAYWLDCSPHERTEEDAEIVAHYARLASAKLNQQREALKEAERFMSYFADETRTFVGPGTPATCLATIREALQSADTN